VRDVRAVVVGSPSWALDAEGAIWCWYGTAAVEAPARVTSPTPVALPSST
jgi:hypothetical protein